MTMPVICAIKQAMPIARFSFSYFVIVPSSIEVREPYCPKTYPSGRHGRPGKTQVPIGIRGGDH